MAKALVLGGASGLLGQALVSVLNHCGWQIESLGRKDGNLLDLKFLTGFLVKNKPDVIFNTIAWTQVDDAEDNAEEAMLVNRTFPSTLAIAMKELPSSHLLHYSTDFVFSGEHKGPWKEDETPCPSCVYGDSKYEGEKAILERLPERSCILRTAWLFGPGKKNFVDTILNACKEKKSLNVVDNQIGSPTYTLDLALWSVLLADKRKTGIWHAVNSGKASWYELASEAAQIAEMNCQIAPIHSGQWPQKARRPENSTLNNSKLGAFLGKNPRPWQQALRDHIIYGDTALEAR